MTEQEELAEREWVYLGNCALAGTKKLGGKWRTHTGRNAAFDAHPSPAVIGGTYLVECSADGERARPRSARFVSAWDGDSNELADLRARSTALATEKAMRAAARAASKESADIGALTLEQARTLINSRLGHNRSAMAATIIRYLRL